MYGKRVVIALNGLTCFIFAPVLSQDLEFQRHMSWSFCIQWVQLGWCVHFNDIGALHENSHFPGKVKNNTGKWNADRYFLPGKCYKYVAARCCTLRLSDISVSETGLRFILSLNSVCKGIKLYLHEIPDIDVAVCSRAYRYFEIKTKL